MCSRPDEVLAAFDAALDPDLELDSMPARELLDLYRELEVRRRRLDALASAVLGRIDRTEAYAEDGHQRPHAFVRHVARCSSPETSARVGVARALHRLPQVAAAAAAGEVPAEHLRALGSVGTNPRLDALFEGADDFFAEHARELSAHGYRSLVRQWERLADTDGAAPTNTQRRNVSLLQTPDGWFRLTGTLPPLDGAQAAAILSRFEEAEFRADRDAAVAEHGESATTAHLPRTAVQRRADAFMAVVLRAASAPAGEGAQPVVDIVVDIETLVAGAADLLGARRPPDDPSRAASIVCRTTHGHDVSPADAALAAFNGLVRRVIFDGAGTVIDLGRRRRLFTGAARDAVIIQDAIDATGDCTCRWPGCNVPLPRTQIDHHVAWSAGGTTNPGNGNGTCKGHNLLKEHGYRPVRGPDGTWRHLRPDGTDITPVV